MKALVVYDSVFGNTEKIAQAIGKALAYLGEVEALRVAQVPSEPAWTELKLLIVGSPTRAFKATPAIKTWINRFSRSALKGVNVAAFDTRIAVKDVDSSVGRFFVKTFGYAADPIAKQLKSKGGTLIVPPEGFFVEGTEGPLRDGELERAAEWAKHVIERL